MRLSISEFAAQGGLKPISPSEPDDLIFVAYSFEPRAATVVSHLADGYAARFGVVYHNEEILAAKLQSSARDTFHQMRRKLTDHVDTFVQTKGSLCNPSVQLNSFRDLFGGKRIDPDSVKNVTVDSTAFNRESLLILFGLLDSYFPSAKKRVLYVSPEGYGDWLSTGFQQVRNVIGLGGLQDPAKRTLLAVLYGFEHHRAIKTIEEHEPSKVLLGFGGTPTEVEFLRRNLEELDKVRKLALSQQEVQEFEFPADNIATCAVRLEEMLEPHLDGYNIVIAPMSTKLSTLSAYLFAKKHPQVQISYCVPAEYNIDSYSQGAKTVFIEELT
jgi:hypothetical protein